MNTESFSIDYEYEGDSRYILDKWAPENDSEWLKDKDPKYTYLAHIMTDGGWTTEDKTRWTDRDAGTMEDPGSLDVNLGRVRMEIVRYNLFTEDREVVGAVDLDWDLDDIENDMVDKSDFDKMKEQSGLDEVLSSVDKIGSSALSNLLQDEGESKDEPDSDFDPVALTTGIAVELEHTSDVDAAKEIAKDHLVEDAHYYDGKEWKEDAVKHLTDKAWRDEVVDEYGDELVKSGAMFSHGIGPGLKLFNAAFSKRNTTLDGIDFTASVMFSSGFSNEEVSKYNGSNVTGMENGVMSDFYDNDVIEAILGKENAGKLIDRVLHGEEPNEALITSVDNALTIDEIATIQEALRSEPVVAQVESCRRCSPMTGLMNSLHICSRFNVAGEMPPDVYLNYKAHDGDMTNVKDGRDVSVVITSPSGYKSVMNASALGDGLYEVEDIDDSIHMFRPDVEKGDVISGDELSMVLTKVAMKNEQEEIGSNLKRIVSGLALKDLSLHDELVDAGIDEGTALKIEQYTTDHSSDFNLNELAETIETSREKLVAMLRPVWKSLGWSK